MTEKTNIFDALTRYGFGERRNMPGLDGLRAMAVALVLFAHLSGSRGFVNWPVMYLFGQFAVRMFFVISGFLITSILLSELEKRGKLRLGRFYFRRTLRLFPASYVFIGITALLGYYGYVYLQHGDLLAAFTYSMNLREGRGFALGHLWTLAIEEQFYLLWPVALMLLGRARGTRVLIALLLLAPVVRVLFPTVTHYRFEILWSDRSFLFWSDALASGCLLSMIWNDLNERAWFSRILSTRFFLLIPIVALAANLVPLTKVYWLVCEPFMNVAIALSLAWAVKRPDTHVGRFLNLPAVTFIGVLSYSLYLWQQPFLLNREAKSIAFAFPFNLILAIAVALLSYLLIEAPMLRLRMAVERRWQQRRASAPIPVVVLPTPTPHEAQLRLER